MFFYAFIVIAGVVASYVAAKFIFLTLFRGSRHLTSRSWKTWGVWVLICASIWTAGFIIAEVIPVRSSSLLHAHIPLPSNLPVEWANLSRPSTLVLTLIFREQFFSDLLSVISSVLTIWFTYGLSGVLWLYDNGPKDPAGDRTSYSGYWSSRSRLAMFLTSVFVVRLSAFFRFEVRKWVADWWDG